MWSLFLVNSLYWVLTWGAIDMTWAFWRSKVACPQTVPVDGICPKGSYYSEGVCAPEPRWSPYWSGSKHCSDKDYVVGEATELTGRVRVLNNFVLVLAQVLVGTPLLDTLGRKPMLMAGLVSLFLADLMYWFASGLPGHLATIVILSTTVTKIMDSFQAAVKAMVIDESGGDTNMQAVAFSTMNVFQYVGMAGAFTACYPILTLNLEDYNVVWATYSALAGAVALLAFFVVPETAGPWETSSTSVASPRKRGGVPELVSAFGYAWEDPLLCGLMCLTLLSSMATQGSIAISNGYAMDVADLSQANASLNGLVQAAAVVVGSSMAAPLAARIGSWSTYWAGLGFATGGCLITAAAAGFRQFAVIYFWLGWAVCGVGWGIMDPIAMTLIGGLLKPDHRGKLMGLKYFLEFVGTGVGSLIWTDILFTTGQASWVSSLAFLVAANLYVGLFLFTSFLYWKYMAPGRFFAA